MSGELRFATRAEMHEYFENMRHATLSSAVARLQRFQREMAATIVADAEAIVEEAAADE